MSGAPLSKDADYYRDISRITVEGLSRIAGDLRTFHDDMANRFQPALRDMADTQLPEASDQLQAVVEETEAAAFTIMDALEAMQDDQQVIRAALAELLDLEALPPARKAALADADTRLNTCQERSMRILEALSFQDLTGQRLRRIVTLIQSIEGKVVGILDALRSHTPTAQASEASRPDTETELKGPQRAGQGLDQSAIDSLLESL